MNLHGVEKPVRRRTGGRSARVRDAVLRAALEALTEFGAGGLTFTEIGRRAGVHATSVQRRWGSRENVLLDALLSFSQEKLPIPNTGSLRGDLIAFAQGLTRYLTSPLGKTVVRTMAANEDDLPMADSRAEFIRRRFEAAGVMIDRAADRGELRPGTERQLALELLSAPLYLRALITRQPIDDSFVERVVDTLMHGLAK